MDLAHSAATKLSGDFVGTQPSAGSQTLRCEFYAIALPFAFCPLTFGSHHHPYDVRPRDDEDEETLELFRGRFVVDGVVVVRPMAPLRRSVSLRAGVSATNLSRVRLFRHPATVQWV